MVVLDLVLVRPVAMWRLRTLLTVGVLPVCHTRGIRSAWVTADGEHRLPPHERVHVGQSMVRDVPDDDGDGGGGGDDEAYGEDELHEMMRTVR